MDYNENKKETDWFFYICISFLIGFIIGLLMN